MSAAPAVCAAREFIAYNALTAVIGAHGHVAEGNSGASLNQLLTRRFPQVLVPLSELGA